MMSVSSQRTPVFFTVSPGAIEVSESGSAAYSRIPSKSPNSVSIVASTLAQIGAEG